MKIKDKLKYVIPFIPILGMHLVSPRYSWVKIGKSKKYVLNDSFVFNASAITQVISILGIVGFIVFKILV